MEYGSTPYVGMGLEKDGFPIKCVQNDMFKLSCRGSLGAKMSPISHSSDIITNQTVSTAKEDLWCTKQASG